MAQTVSPHATAPKVIAEHLTVDLPVLGAARSFRTDVLAPVVHGLVGGARGGATRVTGSRRVIVRPIDDVSFTFSTGDRVGLIGHNGAGKSTLLRVLAGRYPPTSGRLVVDGRTLPLLALGVGMDGDFSGYDNILINGLHLGLSRREIDSRARDIAAFADLGDYIHLPTRTYSAGMLLRLAFSIATATEPDILLVDEVFGAGDAAFYAKAKARLDRMVENASVFVLATHDLGLMSTYCNKAMVMDRGRVTFIGPTADAIAVYEGRPVLVAEPAA